MTLLQRTILFAALLMGVMAQAQSKLALVVGIGEYSKESGWSAIHGDNDIPIVVEMLENNGFEKENIVVLENEKATKQAVIQAFDKLILKAKEGDVVYIHFSGHGQQVTDLDGDEPDGYDESWIPFDACKTYSQDKYVGQNHIIDDELYLILTNIRAKVGERGKIVVVSDACHSGSGSRGDEDEDVVRGTADKFEIPFKPGNRQTKRNTVSWLFVSACKSYQNNFECYFDGKYHGMISYLLWENRENICNQSWQEVMNKIDASMCRIAKYPQQSEREGLPNAFDNKLF